MIQDSNHSLCDGLEALELYRHPPEVVHDPDVNDRQGSKQYREDGGGHDDRAAGSQHSQATIDRLRHLRYQVLIHLHARRRDERSAGVVAAKLTPIPLFPS